MFSEVFVHREVSVQGGLCQGDPPYGNERTLRILLERILVSDISLTCGMSG